jgi:YfiH family protein
MWECSESGFAFSLELSDHPKLWHGFGTAKLTVEALNLLAGKRGLRLVAMDQLHSATIHTLCAYPRKPLSGDGLVTSYKGLLLMIKTADCLPVLFLDSSRHVAAAAHCGWKGTSLRLLPKMVSLLISELGCSLSTLQVALGPCIGPVCYEVGQNLYEVFAGKDLPMSFFTPIAKQPGKYLFDLKASNREQLLESGIAAQNIFSLNYCTHCEKNLYSYRRDAQKAGRLLNFIGWCP